MKMVQVTMPLGWEQQLRAAMRDSGFSRVEYATNRVHVIAIVETSVPKREIDITLRAFMRYEGWLAIEQSWSD